MTSESTCIYTCADGTQIFVNPGKKVESPFDFRVRYKRPGKRLRTPKHIHLVVEMYVKMAYARQLTLEFCKYLTEIHRKVAPIDYYPPKLQFYKADDEAPFKKLDEVGDYSAEFLLIVYELVSIQEKTNYPNTTSNGYFYDFENTDRFSVISGATFRGKKGVQL